MGAGTSVLNGGKIGSSGGVLVAVRAQGSNSRVVRPCAIPWCSRVQVADSNTELNGGLARHGMGIIEPGWAHMA
jgi:hypothetical protein